MSRKKTVINIKPTNDETSSALRLLLVRKFPTLEAVEVMSIKDDRYPQPSRYDKSLTHVLVNASFSDIGVVYVGTWFSLDKIGPLVKHLRAKFRDKHDNRTKAFRVLQFIASRDGSRLTEIQKFIVVKLKGYDWNEKDRGGNRRHAGYWCDFLCGKGGLLRDFCIKGEDGRYRINCLITGKAAVSHDGQRIMHRLRRKKC